MKGIHPNLGLVALTALACALFGVCGCSHNQTGISNPFLAPDRVTPPSTRVIAPGTALPYYQGDPLPVMQSAAPGTTTAPTIAVAAAAATPNAAPAPPVEPKKIAFSKEPAVSVPSDDNSLRFELPKPPEPEPAPVAPIADTRGPPAAAPAALGVIPAVYTGAPTSGQPMNNVAPAAAIVEPASTSPWRSPQIAPAAPPAAYAPVPLPYGAPPGYVSVPPTAVAPPSAEVTLRAVPSPPPAPVESSTPRIRIPGYPAPPVTMNPATISPVLPASSGVSSDGFRPRSSMR
jgi:hypothetical protein